MSIWGVYLYAAYGNLDKHTNKDTTCFTTY